MPDVLEVPANDVREPEAQPEIGKLEANNWQPGSKPSPLVLHAGARQVDRDEINAVVTPPATDTHTPIPHSLLIETVQSALLTGGQHIVREGYGLWGKDGERMFGVMEIQNGKQYNDHGMLIGLRNSHDKSERAKLGLGYRVFICDNWAFSAEVMISRMHTKHILRDLPALVAKGVALLNQGRDYQEKRIDAYKAATIDNRDAHDIVIRALMARAINVQRIDKAIAEWYRPSHEDFAPRTAWSLFNAFTEVLKGSGADLPNRTLRLHGLFDQVVGLPAFVNPTTDVVELTGEDADDAIPVDDDPSNN